MNGLTVALVTSFLLGGVPFTAKELVQHMQAPPPAYSTGPLWVWNDDLTPELVRDSLQFLADRGIRQVWVHPRPGLVTPYLSEKWFELWKLALDVGRERDMLVWIYDENSYPSGFAGGFVCEALPESRTKGLVVKQGDKPPAPDENLYGVWLRGADGLQDMTEALRAGKDLPSGDYVWAVFQEARNSPWYAGGFHPDLLQPGVTEKFLEITLDAYKAHFGDEFGKRIPGSFTDEPHLRPAGEIHWTGDLEERFQERWGVSFRENLPLLHETGEAARTFRYRYFQLLNDLFADRWGKVYYDYCARNNLEMTGHYWEHEWPNCATVPDNMAMAAWQQRPGIDILCNQYAEHTHAQFGNVRSVIEVASVANQLGRERTLCEVYGASGSEMTYADYKRQGDWISVLGINTLNQHLSFISIRGSRKRDHPPTFSWHSPWMDEYAVLADYFTRVDWCMSAGRQENEVLVLEPTTTAWMYHFGEKPLLESLGNRFQSLVVNLAKAQAEFDLGSEAVIRDHGDIGRDIVDNAIFIVGRARYRVVVIPPEMKNLNRKTAELLARFMEAGGKVLSCAGTDLPDCVDGMPDPDLTGRLRAMPGWRNTAETTLAEELRGLTQPTTFVELDRNSEGILYHQRRKLSDGEVLFLVNTSNSAPVSGTVVGRWFAGAREVDLFTGRVYAVPSERAGDVRAIPFTLPPVGSRMLLLDAESVEAPPAPDLPADGAPLALENWSIRPLDDNNLILDYLGITAGGESLSGLFWFHAAAFAFRKHGLERNPFDRAIQFRDTLLTKTFPEDSGFAATYHFAIEGAPPARLLAAIEQPHRFRIACNGTPVEPLAGAKWLGPEFGVVDLSKAAREGENTLTLEAKPMTVYHEIEAVHILGSFRLKPAEKGFVITAETPLTWGSWRNQGMPFYGHRVAYEATFNYDGTGRVFLRMPSWKGVVARVDVNGKTAGHCFGPLDRCELTGLQNGANTVTVVVYGFLRNTLGPHLRNDTVGVTGPGSWEAAPRQGPPAGSEYFGMDYGLDEPFSLYRAG
ncbi:MAG TPA: glycosyl hydrolase [Candidatus Hydrogenedentes bacterium]|nr:glycosyl hydrolase [Candidatus Hydrogenedentota bacterium]